jgi:solute:Na+ symporter, SSS family
MTSDLQIPLPDLCVMAAYLAAILAVGIISSRRVKVTGQVYFLAGRSLPWGVVGAALFASNISTIHLVGLTASGYNEGLVWGNFEWQAAFTLILLALVFAPFYFRSRISTLPEFLERRYSPASRTILAFMAILAALFIHIGMSLYAGAVVFERFFGINVNLSILIVATAVSLYTVLGGLRAVVFTESVNTVVLLVGACCITAFALAALAKHGIHTPAQFRAAVRPGQLSMLQTNSAAGLNWYAIFLGYPVMGVWYWCTDQTIVQRVLGARTEADAQLGPVMAGFLKILPVFLLVLPGVIAYVLFRDQIGADSNQTLPVLISRLIPVGLRGVISAAILAALMSAVSAALNSSGTLVAVDIVRRIRPQINDANLVLTGRISSVVIMILAILWSTQGGRFSSIFAAINVIASDLAPPITTVFLFGVFWRRGTKEASVATLLLGFGMGVVSFVLDLPVFGTRKLITDGLGVSFLMQAWWMFCICSVIFVAVSLMTPAPAEESVQGLTWEHPISVIIARPLESWRDPRVFAGVLLVCMICLYIIFR